MSEIKILYSRQEAARQLSVSVRTLFDWVKEGKIRPKRVGGRVLFPHRELERFASEEAA